ncbi:MAG: hypothetical protein HC905_14740 [Bacteroidales bacterium]|nr:hypothetical protein [Bacteroidales bacterium]
MFTPTVNCKGKKLKGNWLAPPWRFFVKINPSTPISFPVDWIKNYARSVHCGKLLADKQVWYHIPKGQESPAVNTGYTSCGFQSKLQVQGSLASFVTWDNEVHTNSRTLHTLIVTNKPKKETTVVFLQ